MDIKKRAPTPRLLDSAAKALMRNALASPWVFTWFLQWILSLVVNKGRSGFKLLNQWWARNSWIAVQSFDVKAMRCGGASWSNSSVGMWTRLLLEIQMQPPRFFQGLAVCVDMCKWDSERQPGYTAVSVSCSLCQRHMRQALQRLPPRGPKIGRAHV